MSLNSKPGEASQNPSRTRIAGSLPKGYGSPKPLCTSCAYPVQHIYSTYTSASNIRLGVCCNSFLDPLIESPSLVLALDLVLLKPRVFLHLLFNRGCPPLDASGVVALPGQRPTSYDRRKGIWRDMSFLLVGVLLAEIVVRRPHLQDLVYVGGRVICEIAVQLCASTALALVILWIKGWYPFEGKENDDASVKSMIDGRQQGFLPSLVPLVLLYTALLPLLLQLTLGIWYTSIPSNQEGWQLPALGVNLPSLVPSSLGPLAAQIQSALDDLLKHMSVMWQESDRVWAGTRILGGMSAGFGLRVLLPTRPWETTAIVMAGWGAALISGKAWDSLWE